MVDLVQTGLLVGWMIVMLMQIRVNRAQARINKLTHTQMGSMLKMLDLIGAYTGIDNPDKDHDAEAEEDDWGPGA